MNQTELVEALDTVNAAVEKIVQTLKDTIEAGTVSREVEAALAAVVARVKAVDDLVPDAPEPDPQP